MPGQFFVIAHNIRSLFNVGSIFRTADAFGAAKVYLTGYTGSPENPIHKNKIGKTALGAEDFVPWEHWKSAATLIRKIRKEYPRVHIIGLENNVGAGFLVRHSLGEGAGRPVRLQTFKPKFPLVLVLGEEVKGIDKRLLALCDAALEIPMYGKKESLNVSVAFGVAAYEITKSRN